MGNEDSRIMSSGEKQRVWFIRHGERLDAVDHRWELSAPRPYDPPLTEQGFREAEAAAKQRLEGQDIQVVVSSPFLRTLQTAQKICDVLKLDGIHTSNLIVDVLNGHCHIHEQPVVPPSDTAERGIKILSLDNRPIPKFPERTAEGRQRFIPEFNRIADQYWPQNVVVVTHGFGVSEACKMFSDRYHNPWADYCASVELSRTTKESRQWKREALVDIYND